MGEVVPNQTRDAIRTASTAYRIAIRGKASNIRLHGCCFCERISLKQCLSGPKPWKKEERREYHDVRKPYFQATPEICPGLVRLLPSRGNADGSDLG